MTATITRCEHHREIACPARAPQNQRRGRSAGVTPPALLRHELMSLVLDEAVLLPQLLTLLRSAGRRFWRLWTIRDLIDAGVLDAPFVRICLALLLLALLD